MAELLIKNGRIITCSNMGKGPKTGDEMDDVGVIENGFVAVINGMIEAVGTGEGSEFITGSTQVIDADGKLVMPGLVDAHTHLVHYGSRENELMMKLQGKSYLDILKSGGGILSTVAATRGASHDMLREKAQKSLDIMLSYGTTTIEAKSGYGLNLEDEVKCLEVARDMNHIVDIVSTYMGAHAVPPEFKGARGDYISLMKNEVIPYVAGNGLCEYIDCFCEEGAFSVEESREILLAGKEHGLGLKIHADEIEAMGGANLAAELGAASAEHLLAASDEGLTEMSEKGVIAVLLPATSFYLRLGKYARGAQMIKMGIPVAIATDYNPGSSPTESLQGTFVFASMGMGLTPQQVINAVTINAAYAVGRGNVIGSLEKNKRADILIMDAPNENYIVYHFGINHVKTVVKNGRVVINR